MSMYFDDIALAFGQRYVGELSAIHEFNSMNSTVKVDVGRVFQNCRLFPDSPWLRKYLAYGLKASSGVAIDRALGQLSPSQWCAP